MAEAEIPKTRGFTLKTDSGKKKKIYIYIYIYMAHLGLSTRGHILMRIMYICHLHIWNIWKLSVWSHLFSGEGNDAQSFYRTCVNIGQVR